MFHIINIPITSQNCDRAVPSFKAKEQNSNLREPISRWKQRQDMLLTTACLPHTDMRMTISGFMVCRLFSSAVYNDQFAAHTAPEILNTPLDGVVLLMKAMQIEQVNSYADHLM